MNYPYRILAILTLASILCSPMADAQSSVSAKGRAMLYQADTRLVLEKHRWKVSPDQPGKLVADQIIYAPYAGFDPIGLRRLTITFKALSITSTTCVVHSVIYLYGKNGNGEIQKSVSEPFPNVSAENTAAIQAWMKEAETKMATQKPEYAVK